MKLINIFKKETKKVAKSNLQKLEKNQLEKVIGGGDEDAMREKLKATTSGPGNFKQSI